jgi:aryl-alcohol dehydrogenase-like predicted oxidoreductase
LAETSRSPSPSSVALYLGTRHTFESQSKRNYKPDAPPTDSRATIQDEHVLQAEFRPEAVQVAMLIAELARSRGIEPVAFATAWVLASPRVTAIIAGQRRK